MHRVLTLTPPLGGNPDFEGFEQSFDFSGFPRLKAVNFRVIASQMESGPPWIPMALSTLGPTTTPRLSSVLLTFFAPLISTPLIGRRDEDLQQITHQVIRIKREFEGAVNLTVNHDQSCEDTERRFVPVLARPRSHAHSCLFVPHRSQ